MKPRRIVLRPCTPEDKGHEEDCPNGAAERREAAEKSGPSQVATEQYRTGWENVFGAKQTVGVA